MADVICVKSLMRPEVHDVCQRYSVGVKVVSGVHSRFSGSLQRARDSGQWKSKGILKLSQEVNCYRCY